jgi:ribosomal protein S18 acetylase RimI-like enzyme
VVEVRVAEPSEYQRVAELTVAAYGALEQDHLFDGYDDEIRDVAGRARSDVVLVAVDDGEIVGAVTYVDGPESPWAENLGDGEASLRLLAVDPAAQGRGAGSALLRACIDRARASGRHAVLLHTTPWMRTAMGMYEREGFARLPERDVDQYEDFPIEAYRLSLATL